jgi:N-acetylmuramoyl-L-alanine amidase
MKVILDAGHGIETPGKRSPIWDDGSQLFEYEFNRHIVQMVHDELKRYNIDSIILINDEHDMPLYERAERINLIYKNENKNAFLVSVHANAGGGTGWEIFTTPGQTESDIVASYIFNAAHKILPEIKFRRDYSDGDADKEAQFYILRKTHCPAVLTENMFMDTEDDCKFIMSLEGRKKIALLHVNGIIDYIKSVEKK